MVDNGSKVIPFKMVEDINQDNPVKVLSKEEIVLFLQVQHAQGNIIYFPLPGLRDYIVISPSYVHNKIVMVLMSDSLGYILLVLQEYLSGT
jgi:hypothetical protein